LFDEGEVGVVVGEVSEGDKTANTAIAATNSTFAARITGMTISPLAMEGLAVRPRCGPLFDKGGAAKANEN
jgi:hypothetical protein